MNVVCRGRDGRELHARIRSEAPGYRHRPRRVRKCSRSRVLQDENRDTSVDEPDLSRAAQGERRATESRCWWGRSLPLSGRCPSAHDSHRKTLSSARFARAPGAACDLPAPRARLPRLGAQRLGAVSFPAISASPSSFRARRLLRIAFTELMCGATRAGSAPLAMCECSFAT